MQHYAALTVCSQVAVKKRGEDEEEVADKKKTVSLQGSAPRQGVIWDTNLVKISASHKKCTALACTAFKYAKRSRQHWDTADVIRYVVCSLVVVSSWK